MEIKLEEFIINRENGSVVGWAKVDLNGKMNVLLTVLKGQRGVFAKMPSCKINGEFRSAISWIDPEVEKKIMAAIMPEIEKKMQETTSKSETSSWF